MRGGELRRRVTFLQRQKTPDTQGGQTATWVPAYSCWAKAEPLSGAERYQAQALEAHVNWRFTIRYHAGLNTAMRASYGGRILEVRAVIDIEEKHREMQVECEQIGK